MRYQEIAHQHPATRQNPIGDAYRVVWRVDNQPYEGTGLLRDGKLAVVFRTGQQAGIAFYDVRENGTLIGTWTTLGGQSVGTVTNFEKKARELGVE